MLRNIRCGDKNFSQRDRVVRQEEHLEDLVRVLIGVDDTCNVDDEADNQLRHVIYRMLRRLYSEDRRDLQPGAAFPAKKTTRGGTFLRSSADMPLRAR